MFRLVSGHRLCFFRHRMHYTMEIAKRYLRAQSLGAGSSKNDKGKSGLLSVITIISITGVAMGVASLLCTMAITSGFEHEFRSKVLGVNAHVLVMRYGPEFEEYAAVKRTIERIPEVQTVDPFLFHQMMLSHDDFISGVLVKGVDPASLTEHGDAASAQQPNENRASLLQNQLVEGNLEGLRLPGRTAPSRSNLSPRNANERSIDTSTAGGRRRVELERLLREASGSSQGALETQHQSDEQAEVLPEAAETSTDALPIVAVPNLADAEAALAQEDARNAESDATWNPESEERIDEIETLPGIVLGKTLAESLHAEIGAEVSLVSPLSGIDTSMFQQATNSLGTSASQGTQGTRIPSSRRFRVIGIFHAGFQEYDSRLVYIDLFEAQRFFQFGDSVTGLEIRVRNLDRAESTADRIRRLIGAGPYRIVDWRELNASLYQALFLQKIALSTIIASIVSIAAFTVIATLILVVLEKKREIAMLKAMGAKNRSIVAIFSLQGIVIGTFGTLLGILIGGGICLWLIRVRFPLDPRVYLIDHLPLVIGPNEFLVTGCVAWIICAVATLIPSLWAASLRPAEAVRYE